MRLGRFIPARNATRRLSGHLKLLLTSLHWTSPATNGKYILGARERVSQIRTNALATRTDLFTRNDCPPGFWALRANGGNVAKAKGMSRSEGSNAPCDTLETWTLGGKSCWDQSSKAATSSGEATSILLATITSEIDTWVHISTTPTDVCRLRFCRHAEASKLIPANYSTPNSSSWCCGCALSESSSCCTGTTHLGNEPFALS